MSRVVKMLYRNREEGYLLDALPTTCILTNLIIIWFLEPNQIHLLDLSASPSRVNSNSSRYRKI